MSTNWYKFKADMPCGACSNAIQKCLKKQFQDELVSADTSLEEQSVKVTIKRADGAEPYSYQHVYDAVSKSGKTITKVDDGFGAV